MENQPDIVDKVDMKAVASKDSNIRKKEPENQEKQQGLWEPRSNCADQLFTLSPRVCVEVQNRWERSFYLSWLKIERGSRWRDRGGGGGRQ